MTSSNNNTTLHIIKVPCKPIHFMCSCNLLNIPTIPYCTLIASIISTLTIKRNRQYTFIVCDLIDFVFTEPVTQSNFVGRCRLNSDGNPLLSGIHENAIIFIYFFMSQICTMKCYDILKFS